MKGWRRSLWPGLTLLTILLIGFVVFWQAGPWRRQLRGVILAGLADALDREVSLKSAEVTLTGTVRLVDLRIAQYQRLSEGLMLRAPEVQIRVSLLDALLGRVTFPESLRRVVIVRPTIYVLHDQMGMWSAEALFRPKGPHRPTAFQAEMRIEDGVLHFQDLAPPPGVPAQTYVFRDLALRMDFTTTASYQFQLAGRGQRAPVGAFLLSGFIDTTTRNSEVIFDLRAAELARIVPYLGPKIPISVSAGQADAAGQVSFTGYKTEDAHTDFLFTADVRGATLTYPMRLGSLARRLQARSLSGRVTATPVSVRLQNMRGVVNGVPLQADGLVAGFGRPFVDLHVRTPSAPTAQLLGLLNAKLPADWAASAPVSADLTVTGPLDALRVAGQATMPEAAYRGFPLRAVSTTFSYAGRRVSGDVSAEAAGGRIRTRGWADWSGPQLRIAADTDFSDLALAQISEAAAEMTGLSAAVEGTASGSVRLSYEGRLTQAAANVRVTQGELAGYNFSRLETRGEWRGERFQLASFHLESPYGTIDAQGAGGVTGPLDLKVMASGLRLETVAELAGLPETAGQAYAALNIGGTVEAPAVAGHVEAFAGRIRGYPFDTLSAEFAASRSAGAYDFNIKQAIARLGTGEYQLRGRLTGFQSSPLKGNIDAAVVVRDARLQDLLRQQVGGQPALAGLMEGQAQVSGTLTEPRAVGEVDVRRPRIFGQQFDSARALLRLEGRTAIVEGFTASINDSEVAASGRVGPEGIALDFSSDRFPLAALTVGPLPAAGLTLDGAVSFTGKVTGELNRPQVQASLQGDRLTVNGEPLRDLVVKAGWTPAGLTLDPVSFSFAGGRYAARGRIGPGGQGIDLTGQVEHSELEPVVGVIYRADRRAQLPFWRPVVATLARLPQPVTGTVDLEASLAGSLEKPSLGLRVKRLEASLGGQPMPKISADVLYADRAIRINEFSAESGPAVATVAGTVDLLGNTQVDVEVHNLQASVLEPWLRAARPAAGGEAATYANITGSADVFATIAGPTFAPSMVGDVEVSQFGLGKLLFDRLRVTRFTLSGDRLDVSEIRLVKDQYHITVAGTLPFSWSPLGVPRERQLNLHGEYNQDLGLLRALFPNVVARAEGSLEATVGVTGTVAAPASTGHVLLTDGVMRFAGSPNVVEMDAYGQLSGRTFRFGAPADQPGLPNGIVGTIGGGEFALRGDVDLTHFRPGELELNRFDMTLRGQDLGITIERALESRVEADLTITNSAEPPHLALVKGDVRVTNATLGVPRIKPSAPSATPTKPIFNPAVDVEVTIGSGVRYESPFATLRLEGSGELTGRAAPIDLQIAGTLETPGGHIRFPGGTMQVTEGQLVAFKASGETLEEMHASLRAQAQGDLGPYRAFVTVSGPLLPTPDPHVSAYSIPPLSANQIMTLLVGAPAGTEEVGTALGQQTLQALGGAAFGQYALGPLTESIGAGLGLEELGLSFGSARDVRLRVGNRLFQRLYISYARPLSGVPRTGEVRVSYQVRPTLWLGISRDEGGVTHYELATVFTF